MRTSTAHAAIFGAAAGVLCGLLLGFFVLSPVRQREDAAPEAAQVQELLQECRRTQEAVLAALEELRRGFELRAAGLHARTEVDAPEEGEPAARAAGEMDIQSASTGEVQRLLDSQGPETQGPIGSAEEGWQLQRLPRATPNYEAIEAFLRAWPQSSSDLVYAHVDEVVSRFGFPVETSANDQYLVWLFAASRPLSGHPDGIRVKITRNYVVEVQGVPQAGMRKYFRPGGR